MMCQVRTATSVTGTTSCSGALCALQSQAAEAAFAAAQQTLDASFERERHEVVLARLREELGRERTAELRAAGARVGADEAVVSALEGRPAEQPA